MAEFGRIKVGIDYDGVILQKPPSWDLIRRPSKMFLPNNPGAIEGIHALMQPDVDVLGVYTKRVQWLREAQTARQLRRRNIPLVEVTHTTNSSMKKIAQLLRDAHAIPLDQEVSSGEAFTPARDVRRVVLIDDSTEQVIAAAQRLHAEKPEFRNLLKTFTLAAFNPTQPEKVKGLIIPGVIHVVGMQSWAEVQLMLDEVRGIMKEPALQTH